MAHFKTYLANEARTAALGKALAAVLTPGLTIYLRGDLGAGKTALTRSLLQAAGHVGPVKSPTYTLAEPYSIMLQQQLTSVIHFDLFRLSSAEEFLDAGFREYFNANTMCIVEWPEKGRGVLPPPDIEVLLSMIGEGRDVELQALSAKGRECLARMQFGPPP